ncbi:hypothetical protein FCI23_49715 [Actinacidiphila oryziradicis]|uniref:S-adenosylmethionine synthetase N-terminal domain-containing protein n=1 Tax=Actinacidiphila oryziradicis TaxID=2571141 RepID=A0A4U0RNL1_9ACTN|nr:hypothetical protein FCI23_49715 [Actinacidiphila oryziradicis]
MPRRLFSWESVAEGHPDTIADQISGIIPDALLSAEPTSRVAVETLITCDRPRSFATWTCCGRSTPRPPRTAASAGNCPT